MAATGFTPIQLYRTATASAVPTAGNLADGELAINTNDGRLFYKDSGGAVQTIGARLGANVATALGTAVGSAGAFVVNGGALGTPSSGTLTNATGLPIVAGTTGTLTVARGGTGLTTTPTNGQLLIGNGTGYTVANLTQGTGVSITNSAGGITIAATGTGGTVTSVSGTGSGNGISLTGTVTSSGNITLSGTNYAANNVLLGNGTSSFQAVAPGTNGNVLTSNGTTWTSAAPAITLAGDSTWTGTQTFAGTSSKLAVVLNDAAETVTVSATAATGTINYDVTTQSVLFYTTNASGNFVVNIRASVGTALNTALATGQSVTVAFLVTNGGTAYYNTSVQVDGTTTGVTTRWQGGTAPSSGNANSVDIYTYTVVKTGNATFSVFASQTQFA